MLLLPLPHLAHQVDSSFQMVNLLKPKMANLLASLPIPLALKVKMPALMAGLLNASVASLS